MKLDFTIIDQVLVAEYEVIIINNLLFIKYREKFYLVISDVESMGREMICPECHNVGGKNIGSIMCRENEMLGTIFCEVCRTLVICKFDELSERSIKENSKIDKDLLKENWDDVNGALLQ